MTPRWIHSWKKWVLSSDLFVNNKEKYPLTATVSLPDWASRRSNLGPKIRSLLGYRSSDTRPLHLTLRIHNHTSIIYVLHQSTIPTLKVEIDSVLSPPALPLSHYNSRHDYTIKGIKINKIPFLRSSGFPFFTEAMNISPAARNKQSPIKPHKQQAICWDEHQYEWPKSHTDSWHRYYQHSWSQHQ